MANTSNSNLCTLTCTCKMVFGNFLPQNIAIYNFYLKKGWLKHNTENILYYPCFMGEVTNQKWSEVLIDCDLTRKVQIRRSWQIGTWVNIVQWHSDN